MYWRIRNNKDQGREPFLFLEIPYPCMFRRIGLSGKKGAF